MMEFMLGFESVGRICLLLGGGAAALLVCCAVILLVLLMAGGVFDLITRAMAKHWEKTGHLPRNRLGRIILENHRTAKP